ncbi:MAG TPA: hypothetical protein VGP64_01630 [Polyangia bacterium]|jgi:hypothetical protein
MKDPARLAQENVTALEQALLAAGRSYGSSASARNKTLAALGVAGSATLLAGTAQAVPLGTLAQTLTKMTWGKILAAVSLAGAAAAVPGYYAWQHHQAAKATAPIAVTARPAQAEAAAVPSPPAVVARAFDEQGANQPPFGPASGMRDRPVTEARAGSVPATLARELSTLDAARGMLARGDATGALARLDRYAHAYPHGRLALEAEVLRIDALDAAGRSDAARARAQAFLDHHPHSVLAARVRTRLGD